MTQSDIQFIDRMLTGDFADLPVDVGHMPAVPLWLSILAASAVALGAALGFAV